MSVRGIICFGDSIIAGTGASERERSCTKLIKGSVTVPVSLKGRNWNTSQDGLDRLEQDVLSLKDRTHVVILFGNNDCWFVAKATPKLSMEQFGNNMKEIVRRIVSNGQKAILCNLQPIDFVRLSRLYPELIDFQKDTETSPSRLQEQYSLEIGRLANELSAGIIDIRSSLIASPSEVIASDGIHPNDEGHRIIASTVLEYFTKEDSSVRRTSTTKS